MKRISLILLCGLMLIGWSWGCKHEWSKVSEVVLPSAVEQLTGQGKEKEKNLKSSKIDFEISGLPAWATQKTHVVIFSCDKCGKLKKFVTKNFDE